MQTVRQTACMALFLCPRSVQHGAQDVPACAYRPTSPFAPEGGSMHGKNCRSRLGLKCLDSLGYKVTYSHKFLFLIICLYVYFEPRWARTVWDS